MANFVPRLTAAGIWQSPFWYSDNVFYHAGYGLPNCTCYAWGRYYEITGVRPGLPTGDAGTWYDNAANFPRGQTPQLGSILCLYDPNGYYAGHVCVVEQIYGNGDILTSNSGYERPLSSYPPDMSNYFWTETLTAASGYRSGFSQARGYRARGFIYLDSPITPTLPNNWIWGNRYLSQSEYENNAIIVYSQMYYYGWSFNAICGMLGNMMRESTVNPGIWENLGSDPSLGFGLVGWTPATRYFAWANSHGYEKEDGYGQLDWLQNELPTNGDWIPQGDYSGVSFNDFRYTQTMTPAQCAECFCINFERPGVVAMDERVYWANYFYTFLSGIPVLNPPYIPDYTDERTKQGLKVWQMIRYHRNRRRF